mmetsp:Transcript_138/g.252  ORF Transcript_138/g.252 Transcript_138/m.252 type:complete len:300 (-) Transcript_138:264-1163(-)
MPTLTPASRAEEVTATAFRDGMFSALCAGIPSSLAVAAAMKNPTFVKSTNWQSRTAMVIMPALFMFSASGEQKLRHKMEQVASETEHSREVVHWAEQQQRRNYQQQQQKLMSAKDGMTARESEVEREKRLAELYRQGVENSGVRVVQGDTLSVHHQLANFWQENPFKILAAMAVPTVLYIFHGKKKQKHLQLQSQIMHTRVYGQFAVIGMLLTLMGFKSYMDSQGRFITELEAQRRVEEMQESREQLLAQLEYDKKMTQERNRVLGKVGNQKKLSHPSYDLVKEEEIVVEEPIVEGKAV